MAQPINSRTTGDIWHLSIDDLLAPLAQPARLGGLGPFVINLSASTAPISSPMKTIAGSDRAHVYQLQRVEDGRVRYRLRLGSFDSEDVADDVLSKVRDVYPGAVTAIAGSDDLRAIELLHAKIDAQQARSKKPAATPAANKTSAAPAPKAVPRAAVKAPELSGVFAAKPTTPAAPAPTVARAAPAAPTATSIQAAKAASIAPTAAAPGAPAPTRTPAATFAPAARPAPFVISTPAVTPAPAAKATPAEVAVPAAVAANTAIAPSASVAPVLIDAVPAAPQAPAIIPPDAPATSTARDLSAAKSVFAAAAKAIEAFAAAAKAIEASQAAAKPAGDSAAIAPIAAAAAPVVTKALPPAAPSISPTAVPPVVVAHVVTAPIAPPLADAPLIAPVAPPVAAVAAVAAPVTPPVLDAPVLAAVTVPPTVTPPVNAAAAVPPTFTAAIVQPIAAASSNTESSPVPEPPVLQWPAQAVPQPAPRVSIVQAASQKPATTVPEKHAAIPSAIAAHAVAAPLAEAKPSETIIAMPAEHLATVASEASAAIAEPIATPIAAPVAVATPVAAPVAAPLAASIADAAPVSAPAAGTAKSSEVAEPPVLQWPAHAFVPESPRATPEHAAPQAHANAPAEKPAPSDPKDAFAPATRAARLITSPLRAILPAKTRLPPLRVPPRAAAKKILGKPATTARSAQSAPKNGSNASAKPIASTVAAAVKSAVPATPAAAVATPASPPRTLADNTRAAAQKAAAWPAPSAMIAPAKPAATGPRAPQKAAVTENADQYLEQFAKPKVNIETTQTVRALTSVELEDEEALRWFVVQLSVAAEPCDPDTVPNLDIFSVYRLYSVEAFDQGRVMHALRLGFFSEQGSAKAVATYLAGFYDEPTVKRVSVAERERFAEQRIEARKEVGASGKHSIIEITSELVVRELRQRTPTIKG